VTKKGKKMEKITMYITKDESGYSLNDSNGADYGFVSDNLNDAIGFAKEAIRLNQADDFCIDD
jgi:hypothetical protein